MFISDVKDERKVYTKTYGSFAGVDFSSAVTEVDERRSPNAINMIADVNGFPKKRFGWKTVKTFEGRINGIYDFVTSDGVKKMLVHAGQNIYSLESQREIYVPTEGDVPMNVAVMPEDGVPTLLYSAAANSVSRAFTYMGKLYILDGKKYLVYNGTTIAPVENSAYAPTTTISAKPTGGGEGYEPVNLLSAKRKNSFVGTANATVYQLDTLNINSVDKVETLTASGSWTTVTGYSVDTAAGKVIFTAAPGASPVTGEDNVRITFTKNVNGYADRINKCKFAGIFGVGNDLRVFLGGNVNYRNYDRFSYFGRADYFPDTNYSIVGADNSAIMGYLKQYDEMIIVKQKLSGDVGIYSRSVTSDANGRSVFCVKQGVSGIGAVSCDCFANLCDDNLFLCEDGVFGLDTSSITYQRSATLRSFYVNARLTAEPDLKYAFCVSQGGKYYLFVNGRVYIADSKQRNTINKTSFGYEWYYWEGVPAKRAASYEGGIYFGTADGKLCKFKDESDGAAAYSDDGNAIYACWSTKTDDLGDITRYKNITKRNVGVLAMPFEATSGRIYYITEEQNPVAEYSMTTVFDFNNVDFDNFDFGKMPAPTFAAVNTKEKKAKMLGFLVENGKVNEGFGLFKIGVSYYFSKNIK